jgi:hypothetical protein
VGVLVGGPVGVLVVGVLLVGVLLVGALLTAGGPSVPMLSVLSVVVPTVASAPGPASDPVSGAVVVVLGVTDAGTSAAGVPAAGA